MAFKWMDIGKLTNVETFVRLKRVIQYFMEREIVVQKLKPSNPLLCVRFKEWCFNTSNLYNGYIVGVIMKTIMSLTIDVAKEEVCLYEYL